MNRGRQIIILAIVLFLSICTTGCKRNNNNQREINSIDFVRMVGIDAVQEMPGQIKVTLELKTGSGGGGEEKSGGQQEKAMLLSALGNSFSEAMTQIQAQHDKRLVLSHSDFFLVGEAAAQQGIAPFIDFISRSNQIQFTANVYITKGEAAELIKAFGEENGLVSNQLKNLSAQVLDLSNADSTTVIQVMGMLDDPYGGMRIPYLLLTEKEDGKKKLEVGGYALFQNTVLVDFADTDASRGMNFFTNEVYSGIIPIRDANGKMVVTRITDAKTKTKTKYQEKLLTVQVQVEVHTTLEELHAAENVFVPPEYETIISGQNQYIKNLILRAVEEAKQNQSDVLSLATIFRMQHPVVWEDIKENWTQILLNSKFEVEVSSSMDRSYDYEESNRSEQS